MATTTALEILYHHAVRNISPHTTMNIARIALLRRESHKEPIVTLAKYISHVLTLDICDTIVHDHPNLPPRVNLPKLLSMIPTFQEWDIQIPQHVLDLGLHDAIVYEEPVDHIRCLIHAGARVDAILESHYFSPLMIASRKGRGDIIDILLEAGASKDTCIDGHTAFSLATDSSIASRLLSPIFCPSLHICPHNKT